MMTNLIILIVFLIISLLSAARITQTLGNGLTITYNSVNETSGINITLFLQNIQTYVAFGIEGTNTLNKMLGGFVIIGMDSTVNPTRPTIGVYELKGTSSASQQDLLSSSDATLESVERIVNTSYITDTSGTTLSFVVLPGAPNLPFAAVGVKRLIWAYGRSSKVFEEHVARGQASIDFSATNNAPAAVYSINSYVFAHAILMIISFVFLFPTGAFIAFIRPCSGVHWFPYHKWLQIFTFLLSVAGFGVIIFELQARGAAHFIADPHHALGLAVMLDCLFQLINGLLRPHKPIVGHKPTTKRVIWFYIHRLTAFFVLIGGLVNVCLGPSALATFTSSATRYEFNGYSTDAFFMAQVIWGISGGVFVLLFLSSLYSLHRRSKEKNANNDLPTGGPLVANNPTMKV